MSSYSAFFYGSLMSKTVLLRGQFVLELFSFAEIAYIKTRFMFLVLCGANVTEQDKTLKLNSIRLFSASLKVRL